MTPEQLELERERARATADLARRLTPTTNAIGATVTQAVYNENTGLVAVHVDGDPPGASVLVAYLGGFAPALGQRVLVLDTPNDGLTIVGPSGPVPTRTWTPTVSGGTWAIGNGTAAGTYERFGAYCFVHGHVQFGSTSVFGGGTALTIGGLPVPLAAAGITASVLLHMRVGAGTTEFIGDWRIVSGTSAGGALAQSELAAPGNVFTTNVTNGAPGAWQNGNFIDIGPGLYPIL